MSFDWDAFEQESERWLRARGYESMEEVEQEALEELGDEGLDEQPVDPHVP